MSASSTSPICLNTFHAATYPCMAQIWKLSPAYSLHFQAVTLKINVGAAAHNMEPGQLVLVTLQNPREKFWGLLICH